MFLRDPLCEFALFPMERLIICVGRLSGCVLLVRSWLQVGVRLVRSVPEVGLMLVYGWSEVGQKLVYGLC